MTCITNKEKSNNVSTKSQVNKLFSYILQNKMIASESINNSTQENEDAEQLAETVLIYFYFCAILVSIATIVFGVITWTVIPKWRQFRHYVFLCLILTNIPDLLLYLTLDMSPIMEEFIIVYSRITFTHWLMIITVMFYIEFVQVFRSLKTLKHVYLHANVFGWLVPFVTLLLTAGRKEIEVYVTFTLLFINLVLYLNVLVALCKPSQIPEHGQSFCKKLILSTFAFTVTGNFIWFPLMVLSAMDTEVFIAILWPYVITIMFINMFFLMLKSHRELWMEYWCKVKRNKMV